MHQRLQEQHRRPGPGSLGRSIDRDGRDVLLVSHLSSGWTGAESAIWRFPVNEQRRVRQFVVDTRATKPIIVIDAYHDDAGNALCPAATGFTHHVGPWGDIEPCPVIQLATESIHDDRPLAETFNNSEFLRDFRELTAQNTRGCVIMERPDLLVQLAEKHGARDTTVRGSVIEELQDVTPRRSQYQPGDEIPEAKFRLSLGKEICLQRLRSLHASFRR